jgi:hypothetical protein
MDCIIEFQNPRMRFCFRCKDQNQKIILETLLKSSRLTLADLSSILNTSKKILQEVCNGKEFLKENSTKNLVYLLFLFLSD